MRLLVLRSLSCCLSLSSAWSPTIRTANYLQRRSPVSVIRLRSSQMETDVLGGVSVFESWFQSVSGADRSDSLSHDDFGNLRGLSYKKTSEESVMTIPKSIVLDSDFSEPDWDANLAQKLWQECKRGSSSSISGYVQLLTRGQWSPADLPALPPSTAPDALRHWTDSQLNSLKENPSGQKLLDLMHEQEQIWRRKFSAVGDMTWEEFQWGESMIQVARVG